MKEMSIKLLILSLVISSGISCAGLGRNGTKEEIKAKVMNPGDVAKYLMYCLGEEEARMVFKESVRE